MKKGTFYAERVKRLYRKLKQQNGSPDIPDAGNPVDQLVVAMFAYEAPVDRARKAVRALRDRMVDYNEVRVSTNSEIASAIEEHIPDGGRQADAVRRVLNAIFRKEHEIKLDSVAKLGRREARQYLESLDGVHACAVASVLLWNFGAHAIPVDKRLYETLLRENLVDPSASIHEVQAFLERNIHASDAKEFCLLMQAFSSSKPKRSTPVKREARSGSKRTSSSGSRKVGSEKTAVSKKKK